MTDTPPRWAERAPATDGRLVYAIGDIHGRADLFAALLGTLCADAATRHERFAAPPMLVVLGDTIDRGRSSREVIDQLVALQADPAMEARFVLGNHEEAMLDFLEHRTAGVGWAKLGGRQTMASYGVEAPTGDDRAAWQRTREALAAAVPPAHLALMRGMEPYVECGELLFVHAGLRPGIPLAEQDRHDLLYIRNEFLSFEGAFDHFVVHGHTPVERSTMLPGRLNLDTGAYVSGILSAARFDGEEPALFDTKRR